MASWTPDASLLHSELVLSFGRRRHWRTLEEQGSFSSCSCHMAHHGCTCTGMSGAGPDGDSCPSCIARVWSTPQCPCSTSLVTTIPQMGHSGTEAHSGTPTSWGLFPVTLLEQTPHAPGHAPAAAPWHPGCLPSSLSSCPGRLLLLFPARPTLALATWPSDGLQPHLLQQSQTPIWGRGPPSPLALGYPSEFSVHLNSYSPVIL